MKILVCNWRDREHPEAGGAERFTHEVFGRLVDRGHEVTLLTAAFDGCAPETTIDGVRVCRAGGTLTVYRQARKRYRREFAGAVDVVVDEINTRPFMTPGYVEEPVVALVHQLAREFWFYETPFPIDRLGYHWLEDRWLSRYTDVPTLTVSASTEGDLRALGFSDVTVVPEGLDVEPRSTLPETADVPTFVFVGRLTDAKRPDHALDAFDRIRKRLPDAELHVVGDGYLREELQAAAGEGVTVHGYVSEERKRALVRRAHVQLTPGVREGWGLVVTEANALGTPVVGYDVHGLRDSIQHGETGLTCPPEPGAMAAAALRLYRGDRETYARNALEYARQFDWDRTADAVEARLREVADAPDSTVETPRAVVER